MGGYGILDGFVLCYFFCIFNYLCHWNQFSNNFKALELLGGLFFFLISTNSLNQDFSKYLEVNRHYYTHSKMHRCGHTHTYTQGINITMSGALEVTRCGIRVSLALLGRRFLYEVHVDLRK